VTCKEGKILSSGYRDLTLKVWNAETMDVEKEHKINSYARSLDIHNGEIIAGLRYGEIFHYSGDTETLVMSGHGTGEAWGLDICPASGNIVTSCDDNKILTFDVS